MNGGQHTWKDLYATCIYRGLKVGEGGGRGGILKIWLFQLCVIVKRTCISIFSKIGFVDQDQWKLCTLIYLQKMANLQLPIVILKKINYFSYAKSYNVHVYNFSASSDFTTCQCWKHQSNWCWQIYLQIIASCINLQLPIVILEINDYFRHASSFNVHVYQFSAKLG